MILNHCHHRHDVACFPCVSANKWRRCDWTRLQVGEEIREIKGRVSQGPKAHPPLTSIHPPMCLAQICTAVALVGLGRFTRPCKVQSAKFIYLGCLWMLLVLNWICWAIAI